MFAKIEKYNNEYIQWGGGLWSNYGVNDSKNLVFQFQSYKGEGILESRGSPCCECPTACSENTGSFFPFKETLDPFSPVKKDNKIFDMRCSWYKLIISNYFLWSVILNMWCLFYGDLQISIYLPLVF